MEGRSWFAYHAWVSDSFPEVLRSIRKTRRLSQEQLAFDARVSPRHLSCLETGKARPSREMVLGLSVALNLELRERNVLMVSAGYAASYSVSSLDSLALAPVRRAIDALFEKQEPYGAVLIDRCWNVVRLNRGAVKLFGRFLDPQLVEPRVASNILRAALHPTGLRPFLTNWEEVAAITLERLDRECAMFPDDAERRALRDEVLGYPGVAAVVPIAFATGAPLVVAKLERGEDRISLLTMLTTLGTPLDVTAQELTLELYFPADEATERWFAMQA